MLETQFTETQRDFMVPKLFSNPEPERYFGIVRNVTGRYNLISCSQSSLIWQMLLLRLPCSSVVLGIGDREGARQTAEPC